MAGIRNAKFLCRYALKVEHREHGGDTEVHRGVFICKIFYNDRIVSVRVIFQDGFYFEDGFYEKLYRELTVLRVGVLSRFARKMLHRDSWRMHRGKRIL